MPYIKEKAREKLDGSIKELEQKLLDLTTSGFPVDSGNVVYAIYKLLKDIYGDGNFEIKSQAIKVLECCKLEYYRKIIIPYEEDKEWENGDIQ